MSLARIARPSGAFAMVAMDHRESLRAMFAQRGQAPLGSQAPPGQGANDAALVAFKVAVAKVLSPHASGFLIDRDLGLTPVIRAGALDPRCGLIVAADLLVQDPGTLASLAGGPTRASRLPSVAGAPAPGAPTPGSEATTAVEDTHLDPRVDPEEMRALGACALKLLVVWRDDARREARRAMVRDFVALCREARLASVVEGMVMPDRGDAGGRGREAAIVEAARELGGCGPDLYEADVPLLGRAHRDAITERALEVSSALPCPWVVVAHDVTATDLRTAVEAACLGGASGFMAGRALWGDEVGAADPELALERVSVPRLRRLAEIADESATTRAGG